MSNYNKIYLILATVLGANLYYNFLPKPALLFLGFTLLILAALLWGEKKHKKAPLCVKLSFGIFWILISSAIIGSLFFYLYELDNLAVIAIMLFVFLKTLGIKLKIEKQDEKTDGLKLFLYIILGGLLLSANAFSSLEIIKSPWALLPNFFLPVFFIGTFLLILFLHKRKQGFFLPVALYSFLFFSIAGFVYSLGYGFDQFIHEATQKYILENGIITPKPFQYVGFYSINIFIHKITALPIETLDKFLLPALTLIIFPIGFYIFKHRLGMLAVLLLPFSYFIVSTPQGMANLLLLIYIIISWNGYKKIWPAVAIAFIHPISGIAALIYFATLNIKYKKIILAFGTLLFPLAFLILSYKIVGSFNFNFNALGALQDYLNFLTFNGYKQNFNFWLDLIYFAQFLLLPAIILLSVFSAIKYNLNKLPLYIFSLFIISFFITSIFIDFSYLIGYEQKNYTERIFYTSFIFLTPYLIIGTQKIFQASTQKKLIELFLFLIFALFLTSNFYLSYPRWDNYQNNKGKNVAQFMMDAVLLIDNDAQNTDYIVLTDQATSAAALRAYGFKKYYKTLKGEVFYYPIPTGGPLYNEFLNIVYNDIGKKAIQNSLELTNAGTAYIALPSYWENYTKTKERLKLEMDVFYEDKNIVILKEN